MLTTCYPAGKFLSFDLDQSAVSDGYRFGFSLLTTPRRVIQCGFNDVTTLIVESNRRFNYTVIKVMHWVSGLLIGFNLLSAWKIGDFPLEQKQIIVMIHSGWAWAINTSQERAHQTKDHRETSLVVSAMRRVT
jgi:hypothetical protein|tara:strand:- start:1834 stop:2232 length:399 start_codon:yes stop_codon:yes gene_type:complete